MEDLVLLSRIINQMRSVLAVRPCFAISVYCLYINFNLYYLDAYFIVLFREGTEITMAISEPPVGGRLA